MNWTREQTIVALYAYCIIPFNKATNSNALINDLAPKIGRNVNALKMKIGILVHLTQNLLKEESVVSGMHHILIKKFGTNLIIDGMTYMLKQLVFLLLITLIICKKHFRKGTMSRPSQQVELINLSSEVWFFLLMNVVAAFLAQKALKSLRLPILFHGVKMRS